MYLYDFESKTITANTGGYQSGGLPIRDTYVRLGPDFSGMHCIMYEPLMPTENSRIGIVMFHSDQDYSVFPIGGEMARRGFRTLCGQVANPESTQDEKMVNIRHAVEFLKHFPGVEKVILMGHSGGATLMSAYQSVAENGPGIYQGDNMLMKCVLKEALVPADGIMTLDSNWGNGSMTLFSVDPAVVEENGAVRIDPELDVFNPANGYDPEGSEYSAAFLKKFLAAQAERNNAIVKRGLERLHALELGKGYYADDEPFVIPAAAQLGPCNKLFPQDIRLLSHSKKPYTLLHRDGSATEEIIRSVRLARGGQSMSDKTFAAVITTVKAYVSNRAVMAGADYDIREDGAYGIQWNNTFNCTPGNVRHIHAPFLCMGMTGGYEGLASEEVFLNIASEDKTIAFMEGAGHNFDNQEREEFGDTRKIVFDFVGKWLSAPGRFLN